MSEFDKEDFESWLIDKVKKSAEEYYPNHNGKKFRYGTYRGARDEEIEFHCIRYFESTIGEIERLSLLGEYLVEHHETDPQTH